MAFYGLNMSLYYSYENLSIVCVLVYMVAFGCGLGCAMYAYIPEILPPAGVGLVLMFEYLWITSAGKLIPIMVDKYSLNWTINIFLGNQNIKNICFFASFFANM